jgi:dUTPase
MTERLTIRDECEIELAGDTYHSSHILNKTYITQAVKAINKLGTLEDAEEQGRLFVLPCRNGSTVYVINDDDKIVPLKVFRITMIYGEDTEYVACGEGEYSAFEKEFTLCDIGLTIFLTMEKAMAELKEK